MTLEILRDEVLRLFEEHGVHGDVQVAVPTSEDEVIFVVSPKGAANMREGDLTEALTELLGRKVWVTTDGPAWEGRTEPM